MQRVCVYCGSSAGTDAAWIESAQTLGTTLAKRGVGVVYGGADRGLMGAVADAALEAGGEVVGIIPKAFAHRVAHAGLADLRLVGSMHERKVQMFELVDACIALPGGFGTLEEIFEVVTWAQLGMHAKPLGLLNVNGYYDPLLQFLDHSVASGFVRQAHRDLLYVADKADDLLALFETHTSAPVDKWQG